MSQSLNFTTIIRYKTLKPYKLLHTLHPYKPDVLYVFEVNERVVFKDPDPKTVQSGRSYYSSEISSFLKIFLFCHLLNVNI